MIGIWLLILGVVMILIEGVLAALWSVRLSRRGRALNEQLQREQMEVRAAVERLQLSMAETLTLWQPYRRLLRWLRHPLMLALLQSYARRRAAAR